MNERLGPALLSLLALTACQAPAEEAELDPLELDAPAGEPDAPAEEAPSPTPETIVLATVNGQPLTLDNALDTFLSSHVGHGVLVRGEPAVRELAGRLVEQHLFYTEAELLGIPEDQLVTDVVDTYRRGTAQIAYWEREVDDKVHVTDEEVEAFYAKTDVALGILLMETETRSEAEALRERVAAGEDFAKLAEESSIHETRTFGGALPYVRRGEIELSVEQVAFALEEPGSLSEIVETEAGFAFVRLEERMVNPIQAEREIALPQIRQVLEGRREEELREAAEAEMNAAAGVEVEVSLLTRENVLGESTPEAVVGRSAGEAVTLGELRAMLRLDAIGGLTDEQAAEVLVGIINEWARKRAEDQLVERSGMLEDPEVVEQTESFRRDVILRQLYEKYVYAEVEVTDEEVREYYESRKEEEFTQPAEYRLAYIVVETEEDALKVLERAEAGEEFTDLAREASIDSTASAHGGRIGWVREGTLLPEVEGPAFALEVGSHAGPIETPSGFFVVKLLDYREPHMVPFETSARTASGRLTKERQQAAYAKWAEALHDRADAAIHDEGIRQAVAWLDEQAALQENEPETEGMTVPVGPSPHANPGELP